jgi:hypothetical protein
MAPTTRSQTRSQTRSRSPTMPISMEHMQLARDAWFENAIAGKDIPLGMSATTAWKTFSSDLKIVCDGGKIERHLYEDLNALDNVLDLDEDDISYGLDDQMDRDQLNHYFNKGHTDGQSGIACDDGWDPNSDMDGYSDPLYYSMLREFYMKGYVCKSMNACDVNALFYDIFLFRSERPAHRRCNLYS